VEDGARGRGAEGRAGGKLFADTSTRPSDGVVIRRPHSSVFLWLWLSDRSPFCPLLWLWLSDRSSLHSSLSFLPSPFPRLVVGDRVDVEHVDGEEHALPLEVDRPEAAVVVRSDVAGARGPVARHVDVRGHVRRGDEEVDVAPERKYFINSRV